jgi:hypothetical protein
LFLQMLSPNDVVQMLGDHGVLLFEQRTNFQDSDLESLVTWALLKTLTPLRKNGILYL